MHKPRTETKTTKVNTRRKSAPHVTHVQYIAIKAQLFTVEHAKYDWQQNTGFVHISHGAAQCHIDFLRRVMRASE